MFIQQTQSNVHTPVYHFALALPGDHVQQRLAEVVSDAAVPNYLVSEDDQAQVIHILDIILLHIHAVLKIQTHKEKICVTWQGLKTGISAFLLGHTASQMISKTENVQLLHYRTFTSTLCRIYFCMMLTTDEIMRKMRTSLKLYEVALPRSL